MMRQVEQWQQAADNRHVFLSCYAMMTRNMLEAAAAGEFHDPQWVSELLHHFAEYYFVALDSYERNVPDTPTIWRVTHDAASQDHTMILQNLALGVNAHINYDLVLALVDMLDAEWALLLPEQREQRYQDHCHVNAIIARTIDDVQDQVLESQDPALDLLDRVLGRADEWVVSRMIADWRDAVWHQATHLLDCQDKIEQDALRLEVEGRALERARAILAPSLSALADLP
jgi:hypothetical protein